MIWSRKHQLPVLKTLNLDKLEKILYRDCHATNRRLSSSDSLWPSMNKMTGTFDTCFFTTSVFHSINWIQSLGRASFNFVRCVSVVEKTQPKIWITFIRFLHQIWPEGLRRHKLIQSELYFSDNILLRRTSVVIPQGFQEQMLKLAHERHPGIVLTFFFFKLQLSCKQMNWKDDLEGTETSLDATTNYHAAKENMLRL